MQSRSTQEAAKAFLDGTGLTIVEAAQRLGLRGAAALHEVLHGKAAAATLALVEDALATNGYRARKVI